MVNPCVPECKERSVTCHGTCEKYKTWKAEYEEQKKCENRNRLQYSLEREKYSFGRSRRPSRSHKK